MDVKGGCAKSNDTSRMDVSQRGTQRSSIKSGLGQPAAKQRPDTSGFPVQVKSVCVEFGSSGWSGSPRPSLPGHGRSGVVEGRLAARAGTRKTKAGFRLVLIRRLAGGQGCGRRQQRL